MHLGVYIHIPFCQQKCLYCDFPSYANLSHLYQDYVAALCREIADQGGLLSTAAIDTVYIGGGTPTILPAKSLIKIIECVYANFTVVQNAEISIEANPGTVERETVKALADANINRISFGVQSFDDQLLQGIGRIHSASEALQAVIMAQEAGLKNINIDLIYGLPGQTVRQLQESFNQAAALGIPHISAYGLKVEEGTPFAALEAQGLLALPDEESDEAMYDLATRFLPKHGFRRYEISNFALPGMECRHNLKYWHYQPYLGVGVAAHSFLAGERSANTTDVREYIQQVGQGRLPVTFREALDLPTAMAEFVFLALRTANGMAIRDFNAYFHQDFFQQYANIVANLKKRNLLAVHHDSICLTESGMKYGNVVFRAFLPNNT